MRELRLSVLVTFLLGLLAIMDSTSGIENAVEPPVAEIPILRHDNGHLTVSARVEAGESAPFVLDTAATKSMVTGSLLDPLSLEHRTFTSGNLNGASGRTRIKTLQIASLAVGDAVARDLDVVYMDEEAHGHVARASIAGIVGIDFLSHFDVEVDLADMRMRLYSPGQRPFARERARLPLKRIGEGIITIAAVLDGQPITAILDTGARRSIVNWAAARGAGLHPKQDGLEETAPVHGAAAHTTQAVAYEFKSVAVGGTSIERPSIDIADLHVFRILNLKDTPALILGADLLEGTKFALDSGIDTLVFLE